MDREEIRLECLKLAVSQTAALDEVLGRGEKFYEFVTKQADNAQISSASQTAGETAADPAEGRTGPKSSWPFNRR